MSKLILRNSEGKIIKEMPFNKNETNEEWFDTLSTTEEKAEAIYECVMANSWSFSKDGIKRWLKQPYREEAAK